MILQIPQLSNDSQTLAVWIIVLLLAIIWWVIRKGIADLKHDNKERDKIIKKISENQIELRKQGEHHYKRLEKAENKLEKHEKEITTLKTKRS